MVNNTELTPALWSLRTRGKDRHAITTENAKHYYITGPSHAYICNLYPPRLFFHNQNKHLDTKLLRETVKKKQNKTKKQPTTVSKGDFKFHFKSIPIYICCFVSIYILKSCLKIHNSF